MNTQILSTKCLFIISVILICCLSCKNYLTEEKHLLRYCRTNDLNIDYDSTFLLIIIPCEGCISCVNIFLEFLSANYNSSAHYIFSSIYEKDFHNLTDRIDTVNPNIYFDSYNLVSQKLVDFYPKAYYFSNNKLRSVIELKSENDYTKVTELL